MCIQEQMNWMFPSSIFVLSISAFTLFYQLLQQAMFKDYVVFIPRHYPKDNDCWRGQWWFEESGYRPVTSFDPDLYALARDLELEVDFFAVFYGTYFLFVERQTMRSFKCAYGHHRKVIYSLRYQRSRTALMEAFTYCINKATGTQSSDRLLRTGDLKPPHAVFIAAGLDSDRILENVIRGEHSTDEYPCLIRNVSEVDLQDIDALIERVKTDERGLNQDFFNIIAEERASRFVSMDTGEVFECYHEHRHHVISLLRSDPSMFGKLKEMAEECDDKIYSVDIKTEPIEIFLNGDECDYKVYAADGFELKDGDIVHIDIVDDAVSVEECDSVLHLTRSDDDIDAKNGIAFKVRIINGKLYLRETLEDGSEGRYLSVEANEGCGDDYLETSLKSNEIPTEDKRIVFRRHKVFKHMMTMAKATNKDQVSRTDWYKHYCGAFFFEIADSTDPIQFVRSGPL
ncbi:hypothetical protein GQ42DRAFT_22633 [Ramicandelaber brevisporus]|nr:hypothetical protein GQ42DRAFT_22633 [Ramicandelaber brevisporus]